MIKIALAQINPTVGDIKANYLKITDYIKKAKIRGADLVVFPELALSGYPPEDLLLKDRFIAKNKYFLSCLKQKVQGIVALVGFIDKKNGLIYNSCAVIQDKKIRDIYRKIILPNYGVFDEKRYFTSGTGISSYSIDRHKFVVSICEDIWDSSFVNLTKKIKPNFVINISASPFHLGKIVQREKVLAQAAKQLNSYMLYCNLVGGQDEIVFDGTSKVISPKGKVIAFAKRFTEDMLIFDFDSKENYPIKKIPVNREEEVFSALRLGLYDYVKKNGFKKVIVGVSGGIDSAVVVSLASLVLGKENVQALIMPSCYTSKGTFDDAKQICENLGIKYAIVKIDSILKSYLKDINVNFKSGENDKVEENLQARIRGNILMAFSNKFGHLVLNTGNKSEVSCGYCTLYGDMVGGFGILKDVTKTLTYRLAHYINKISNKNVIPLSVIKRPPSAELKPNQKDSDTLPPYDLLDPILKQYVENNYSLDKISRLGFKKDLVKKVIRMVDLNEYKRRQAPIGIKITPRAFGKDRRMPITNRFFD